jgi:geranylgeranyl diphosphate synthase, type III
MDLFWRENLVCPTEPEYIEMVNNSTLISPVYSIRSQLISPLQSETGGLFRIAIKLMMAASPEPPRFVSSPISASSSR